MTRKRGSVHTALQKPSGCATIADRTMQGKYTFKDTLVFGRIQAHDNETNTEEIIGCHVKVFNMYYGFDLMYYEAAESLENEKIHDLDFDALADKGKVGDIMEKYGMAVFISKPFFGHCEKTGQDRHVCRYYFPIDPKYRKDRETRLWSVE